MEKPVIFPPQTSGTDSPAPEVRRVWLTRVGLETRTLAQSADVRRLLARLRYCTPCPRGGGGGGEILCGSANSFNCYEIIDAFSRPHQMLELEVLSLIGKLNNARMSRAADRIRWKAIRLTSICETHNRIFRP